MLGVTMGVASGVPGLVRGGWEIRLINSSSMVCIAITANLIGTVPLFTLSKLRTYPAMASSPLITSIVDITGLIIYFMLTTWLIDMPNINNPVETAGYAAKTTLMFTMCLIAIS